MRKSITATKRSIETLKKKLDKLERGDFVHLEATSVHFQVTGTVMERDKGNGVTLFFDRTGKFQFSDAYMFSIGMTVQVLGT